MNFSREILTTTVDVARFCTELEAGISESLKTVEFLVVYHRTNGKDLSRFIENYTTRLKVDLEWVTTWVDIWCKYATEKNGFAKIVRECTKINKARAKAEEKQAKEQARAEAKQARAMAPKAKAKVRTPTVKAKPVALIRPSNSMTELYDLQANMLREAWTVTTRIDTIMLNKWLDEAIRYQTAVMTNPRAQVPEPIKLTSDVCFSTPMVSMGRRRVAGVKYLREVARGAPKGNRERIDNIVKLYESNEIKNIKTAEAIVTRLTSRTARKILTDKTDKMYNKLVEDPTSRKSFDLASGKRKPEVKP